MLPVVLNHETPKTNIHTVEEFLEICKNNDIKQEWYALNGEKAPVYLEHPLGAKYNSVLGFLYREIPVFGQTLFDVMFAKLLKYKQWVDWYNSDNPCIITDIKIKATTNPYWNAKPSKLDFPYVQIAYASMSFEETLQKDIEEKTKDGWTYAWYDQYDRCAMFHRKIHIKDFLQCIEITFDKKTDERDIDTFGFDADCLLGSFSYSIPDHIFNTIIMDVWESIPSMKEHTHRISLNNSLSYYIVSELTPTLIDDEYKLLNIMKHRLAQELAAVIEQDIPDVDKKQQFKLIKQRIASNCPELHNTSPLSRYSIICDSVTGK